MSQKKIADNRNSKEEDDNGIQLTKLTVPTYISHLKVGTTLCANDELLLLQDGATTIEVRKPPKFEPKSIPWRQGVIRDIAWCSNLNIFVIITQKSFFSFDPKPITPHMTPFGPKVTITDSDIQQIHIKGYESIKPSEEKHSFWRCTCLGKSVFIVYSGFGTMCDEYELGLRSYQQKKHWTSPVTCAHNEGIWSIRSHPETGQLGMTIMNAETNAWRFEIRNPTNLSPVFRISLPIANGDCELSPLNNREWLVVNSVGIRLIHIGNDEELKSAVEYERELRNGLWMKNKYLAIRTKYTVEVHTLEKKNDSKQNKN